MDVDVSIHTIAIKHCLDLSQRLPAGETLNSLGAIDALFADFINRQHQERDEALAAIENALESASAPEQETPLRKMILRRQPPNSIQVRPNLRAVYGFIEVCANGDPAQVTRAANVDDTIDIAAEDYYHRPFFYMLLVPLEQDCSYIFLESKSGRGGLGGLLLTPFKFHIKSTCNDYFVDVGGFSTSRVFQSILNNGGFEKLSFYKRERQYDSVDGTNNIPFEVEHRTTINLNRRGASNQAPLIPWRQFEPRIFRDEHIIFPGIEELDYDRCKVTLNINGRNRTIDLGNNVRGFIPNYQLTDVLESDGLPHLESVQSKAVELFDDLMQSC